MTAQELFDRVVNGLRKQGQKSLRDGHSRSCVYRNSKGCKCAAGFLIEDNEYASWMEGVAIDDLIFGEMVDQGKTPMSLVNRLRPHHALVSELQQVHDVYGVGEWDQHFQKVASDFNLTYTPPTHS